MKSARHAKILELIDMYDIETQEDLLHALKSSGFSATQATISRDINELHLYKTVGNSGIYHYTSLVQSNEVSDSSRLFSGVLSVENAMNLVVIKTTIGKASGICADIDKYEFADVVGTIAGDDTIFLAMTHEASAIYFIQKFKEFL